MPFSWNAWSLEHNYGSVTPKGYKLCEASIRPEKGIRLTNMAHLGRNLHFNLF